MTMTLPMPLPVRVALLGSGELGKEVTIALQRYGCTVIACDSYANAPAMQVADSSRVFDMSDPAALRAVLDEADVDLIVPEVEAIATDELSAYEERGVRVVPNAFAVQATMDRQRIRNLAASLPGVRTSDFRFASSEAELSAALEEIGYPAFVKPTMSSSGHGQSRVDGPEQAGAAWAHAEEDARATTGVVIVEEGIDFDYEITLLTVRSWDQDSASVVTSFCVPIGHRQEGGDYVESWQPMAMSEAALASARDMAKAVTDALAQAGNGPCLGLFGVEFFVRGAARTKFEPRAANEVLIITGYSGAGRTGAARALEDLDWYVVDNLPPTMLPALVGMMSNDPAAGVHRLAVGVDVRSRTFFRTLDATLEQLKGAGIVYRVIFLEASPETLVRRYESNRRPHPLQGAGTLMDGIKAEMRLLAPLRRAADEVIDTSTMSVHDLTRRIRDIVAGEERPLQVTVESFGFKHGLPLDADHVVDVRFLKNPYWVDELRHLTGKDQAVADYVLSQPGARDFALGYADLLAPMLDGYLAELKPFVTIAIGCTGGKHRSVACSEAIAARLRERGHSVRVMHRDIGRE